MTNLQLTWTYHSRYVSNNIQCNPIIARDLMYAPTPDKRVVAADGATGEERWGFRRDEAYERLSRGRDLRTNGVDRFRAGT